jgi:glyoxylase-like metal-dependent hydrolase (beta-lactamase superfamily II)
MEIQHFFDQATSTLTYVVHDAKTGIVFDPVLDYDPKSARTSVRSAEAVAKYIDENNLAIPYVIDTHAHTDHLTATPLFEKRFGARMVTGDCTWEN